jgi:hypothetical protein
VRLVVADRRRVLFVRGSGGHGGPDEAARPRHVRSPLLCGACGAARVWPVVPCGTSETPMEGGTWAPPDGAVAELRRLAFNRH